MSVTEPNSQETPVTSQVEGVADTTSAPEAQQQIPYTYEQVLEMEQFAIAAARRLEEVKEYQAELERLKNPEYREFWNNAVSYYENGKKTGTTEEPQARRYEPDAETKEVLDYVREQRAREKAQQEQDYNKWLAEQNQSAQKMRKEYGLNDEQLGMLAEFADVEAKRTGKRVGFQQAYERVSSIPRAGNTPPTVGLRGDASMPGVPGPSSNNGAFLTDFHGALTSRLKAGN